MATGGRPRTHDLTHLARLAEDPERVHLFHALRVIEASFPEAPRLGESKRPREDKVRLGQTPDLAFPPATIESFEAPQGDAPGRMTNRFFGMFGANGPLPLHLTEYARDRQRNHRDTTLTAFADMLTHRVMGLFYRAWSSAEPAPSYDRPEKDPFAKKIASLSGHHGNDLTTRDGMPDDAKRHFAGHLALASRPAEGLKALLSGFFQAPVYIEEYVGSWLDLEPEDQWQMGMGGGGLGQTTNVGSRVWTRNAKFRIHVGPLPLDEYERLLPSSDTGSLDRLSDVVRNYCGDVLDWDVHLILRGDEVPQSQLGAATKLGQTSWVGARDPDAPKDAGDLYLTPHSPSAMPALDTEGLPL